jgi:hypothetical protein
MIEGRAEEACVHGPNGEALWAGGFPVPKTLEEDRAMTDARKRNWNEHRRVPKVRLPCGSDFGHRLLHKGKVLIHDIFDLPHYFHHLYTGEEYIPYSPLGPPLSRKETEKIGLKVEGEIGPSGLIQPCLRVLAMGDHKAVGLAQSAHEAMLRKAGVEEAYLMRYGCPLPSDFFGNRTRPWVSVCIDDTVFQSEVNRVGKDVAAGRGREEWVDRLLEVYKEVGTEPKASKVKREVLKAKVLGSEIDGNRGWCSAPAVNLCQLMSLSLYVFERPLMTKKTAQKLCGSWVWPLMHRKEVMCVLDSL